jgi:hypothetical protein
VNIDLNNLKSIDLDLANNLVTVGSGVENAQVYDLLSSVGKETRTLAPLVTSASNN